MRSRRFSRRRFRRKPARFRRVLRRIRRHKRYFRKRKQAVFRPRALFPLSVQVSLPIQVSFSLIPGAAPGPIVGGWWLLNTLSYTASTGLPRGAGSLVGQLAGLGTTAMQLANSGSNTDSAAPSAFIRQFPVALAHLGNVYQNYRVNSASLKLQIVPAAGAVVNDVMVALGATDDLDLASTAALYTNCNYVSDKILTYFKTRTMQTQNSSTSSQRIPTFYNSWNCARLMRDSKQYYADTNWIGKCTAGSSGGTPSYGSPTNNLYVHWSVQNMIPNTSMLTGGSGNICMSINMTYTLHVKFFEPHANTDLQNPL